MDLLKSTIYGNIEQEFVIDNTLDTCCFQFETAQSTLSMGFEDDIYLCDSIQTFQDDPDHIEHTDHNFNLNLNEESSFDQKKQKELKELTFELATDPSPNSEFLVRVTETLNSILQNEFKALDFQVSPLVKQNGE
ncbi:Uncharacterized protein CTYZ_00002742 [Cryptosporidium tyzzeri]|nr:Uncharacterized protein CTYZ_00002742 [Cryptosporidium tyzzeri]